MFTFFHSSDRLLLLFVVRPPNADSPRPIDVKPSRSYWYPSVSFIIILLKVSNTVSFRFHVMQAVRQNMFASLHTMRRTIIPSFGADLTIVVWIGFSDFHSLPARQLSQQISPARFAQGKNAPQSAPSFLMKNQYGCKLSAPFHRRKTLLLSF